MRNRSTLVMMETYSTILLTALRASVGGHLFLISGLGLSQCQMLQLLSSEYIPSTRSCFSIMRSHNCLEVLSQRIYGLLYFFPQSTWKNTQA